jgi:uncharacterized protein (DUF2141 family)
MMQCAQQTPITGGEKDTVAPIIDTLKLTAPANGSINFNTQSITINFNELVVLKNADKQIIITPFLESQPDIYTKGKKVIVDFKEPLSPNTTYIINFGDAIVDITEGNVFRNYKYVFSTGSYIDSLQYEAFVYEAASKKSQKDILVMLYKDHEDSVVSKIKPSYFGKTNASGKCVIQNIAAGEYKVVALKDENGNYKFDPKEELIGYREEKFIAASDTIQDTIGIFLSQPEQLEIISSTVNANGKGTVILNTQIHKDSIIFADSVKALFIGSEYTISKTRDTIQYWINPSASERNKYPMIVVNGKKFNTYLKQPTDSILKFKTNAGRNLKPQEDLYFEFFQPIETINEELIKLFKDSTIMEFEIIQTSLTKVMIAADFKQDFQYKVELLPGAVTSYYNIINDTITALFEKNEANKYGNIILSVDTKEDIDFILALMEGEKTIKTIQLKKSELANVNFQNLKSGKYSFRLIFDANSNGIWDTGNYYEHTQPERVEYYNEEIDLKKGWDMDLSWIIK